ncbi:MAG: glycosyltransferase family 4 protein [Candidatus Eisenbacteria bacterium]
MGGGETQMRLLMRALSERGLECQVVTQRRPADALAREDVDGIPVSRVWPRGKNRSGKYLMMVPSLFRLFALRDRYDVILVSGIRTLGVVGVLAASMFGRRCVLRMASCGEMSGGYLARDGRPVPGWMRLFVGARNRVLRKADRFLAVSQVVREEYVACGVDPARIEWIPNGTDVTVYRPVDGDTRARVRAKLELPVDRFLCVYTGKLNRGKGLEMLLRVWKRWVERRTSEWEARGNGSVAQASRPSGPAVHLVLVGGGGQQATSCEAELREFVRDHSLEADVTFTGYTTNVAEYLQAADLFLLPSDSEAMPNSLIEAMASGLPCVASAVGGVLDILEDGRNGRTHPAGDEDRLLRLLSELYEDEVQRVRIAKAAREDAERIYAREVNVDKVVRLLAEAHSGAEAALAV